MPDRVFGWLRRTVLVVTFAISTLCGPPVLAADYPTHPIRLVVGFDAGTSADLGARQLTPGLSAFLHQNVIVENHPGAAGIVAGDVVAKAAPDGYTLLFDSAGHVANVSLYKTLPFDAVKDFTPIGRVDAQYFTFVVSATLPVTSVAELIAYAKARPGQLNYASTGNGTTAHLAGALFGNLTGLQITHVPYKSASQALVDLIGNQVQMMFYPFISLQPMITAGKLRVLATTGQQREPYLPNAPTMQQAGVSGFQASTWHGIYGPAKLPRDITDQLNAAITQTLKDPTLQANMAAAGVRPSPSSPAEFAAFTVSELDRYKNLVAISGAKVE